MNISELFPLLAPGDMGALPSGLGAMPSPFSAPPSVPGGMPSGVVPLPSGLGAMPSPFSAPPSVPGGMPSGIVPLPSGLGALPNPFGAGPSVPSGVPSDLGALPSGVGAIPSPLSGTPSVPGSAPNVPGGTASGPSTAPGVPGGTPSVPSVGLADEIARLANAIFAPPTEPVELAGLGAMLGFVRDVPAAEPAAARPSAEPSPDQPYFLELGGFPATAVGRGAFDPHAVKRDFPILEERVNGRPLVWLDNAATTQKPRAVIERLASFYAHENSNVHRAAHTLAGRATDAYEGAREKVRSFLHAPSTNEIVFVRGATEAINLVAQSFGRRYVGEGDEIVVTELEHHANLVPWQLLAEEKRARLRVVRVDDSGQVLLDDYERLLGPRTRIVSIAHVSNALGTIVPVREMTAMAHRYGARVLIDGAQAVSHLAVDVQALDCDFYCFSGHKVFGPTGIGALFGKADVLEAMPPWQGGGNMISDVTLERSKFQPPPARFEAGTGNIADAVGLGAALDYVTAIGLHTIGSYEHELLIYATEQMSAVPGLRIIGTAAEKAGVLSFVLDGQRTEDVSQILDADGIAVRSGHHCAQPILRRFGLEASVRASLALYNTCEDIDALVAALLRLQASRPAH